MGCCLLSNSSTFIGGSRGCYNTKSFRTHRKSSSANSLIHFSGNFQNLDGYSKGVKNLFHAVKKYVIFCHH